MVGPEAFSEVKYLAHAKQMTALERIPELAKEFHEVFGRPSGGLVHTYQAEDAETMIVALGSVLGTIKDTVDEMREHGSKIGVLGITSFRPFPLQAVRAALENAQRVVVLEKALAVGIGGIVSSNVRTALSGIQLNGYTAIAGLGGRAITKASLHKLFADAEADRLEPLTFVDMDWELVQRELERGQLTRRHGTAYEHQELNPELVSAQLH